MNTKDDTQNEQIIKFKSFMNLTDLFEHLKAQFKAYYLFLQYNRFNIMIGIQLDLPEPDMMSKLKSYMDELSQDKALDILGSTLIFGIACNPEMPGKFGTRKNNWYYNYLYEECKFILREYFPNFRWNQIFLHFNYCTHKHVDTCGKDDEIMIISFGDYEGGNVVMIDEEGTENELHTKNRVSWMLGGRYEHFNRPITGRKYSFCVATTPETVVKFGDHPAFC